MAVDAEDDEENEEDDKEDIPFNSFENDNGIHELCFYTNGFFLSEGNLEEFRKQF